VAYTDDVGIMVRRLQDVEEVCILLVEETNKMALQIKGNETKFISVYF
jgi:ABC-type branched-subunit amino acid transport system ATPase component